MHPDGDIRELRPLRDRILFVGVVDGKYVLLHQFMKKTQKTPAREIKKAKNELKDFKERSGVKQPIIARMENGTASPNLSTVLKVLAALGKTLYIGDL